MSSTAGVSDERPEAEPTGGQEKTAPRRRWLRWLRNGVFALLVIFVLLRVSHPLWLPRVVDRLVASRGLQLVYEDLDLSLLGGRVDLSRIRLEPRALEGQAPAPEPLAVIDYVGLDLDVSALLTGSLRVHRVEVDGVVVHASRDTAGDWNFAPYLTGSAVEDPADESVSDPPAEEAESAAPSDEVAGTEPQPIDFGLPIQVDAAVIHGVRVYLFDELAQPPLDTVMTLDVAARDVGHEELPARIAVTGWAAELLDALRVDVRLSSGERSLEAEGQITLAGLGIERLAPYLESAGLRPEARALGFEGAFSAALEPSPDDGVNLIGGLRLGPFALSVDDEESVALDAVEVRIEQASSAGATVGEVLLQGLRGVARRDSEGVLHVAGLALVGTPAGAAQDPEEAVADEPVASDEGGGSAFALVVDRVSLQDARFELEDDAVDPPVTLALAPWIEVTELVIDPQRPGVPVNLELGAVLEGAGTLRVAGTAVPTGDELSFDLTLEGEDLTLRALASHLEAAGLESTLEQGALELPLRGVVRPGEDLTAELSLGPLRFADGERALLQLEQVSVSGVRVAPGGDVDVEQVLVQGAGLGATLLEDGGVLALGLRTVAQTGAAARGAAETERASARTDARDESSEPSAALSDSGEENAAQAPEAAPRIRVGRLAVEGLAFDLDAAHFEPALDLDLRVDLSIDGLTLGGDVSDEELPPASLVAEVRARDLFDSIELSGTLLSRPGQLDLQADLALAGSGVRTDAVDGLLNELGIESSLVAGTLAATLQAEIRQDGETLRAGAAVSALAFVDEERELVALDALRVRDLALEGTRTSIGALEIEGPRIELARGADGAFEALGLRFVGVGPAAAGESGQAQSSSSASTSGGGPGPGAGTAEPEASPVAATFLLETLSLEGARVSWSDAFVDPPVEVALTARASVKGVDTSVGATPTEVLLESSVDGAVELLSLGGEVTLDPEALSFDFLLSGIGLRAGPLTSYLPAGVESTLSAGELAMRLRGSSSTHADGGRDARLELEDLGLRDGEREWFALGALRFEAERLDGSGAWAPEQVEEAAEGAGDDRADVPAHPASGVFDIRELRVEGLTAEVRNTAEGLEVFGLRISPAPAEGAESEAIAGDQPSAPLVAGGAPVGEGEPATDARMLSGDAGAATGVRTPPMIRLGALDVGIADLTFVDEAAGGEPLHLALALVTDRPQLFCTPAPEDLPPLELTVRGRAEPIVETITAGIEVSPYAAEPQLDLDFALRGIRGAALTRVLPALAESMDADALENGQLTTKVEAVLRLTRRGPVDFDLGRGFGAEIAVTDVALRPLPEADALVGFERLEVDVQRMQPKTGELRIKSIELTGTRARVRQEAEGMRIAGVLLKTPPVSDVDVMASEDAASEGSPDSRTGHGNDVASDAASERASEVVADGTPSAPEQRVDELRMTGLDFLFEDVTVDPPMLLPIVDLELEVRGLSTRVLEEPRSVSFRAIVDAGEVPLPERTGSDHLLVGVLGSLASAVTLSDESYETELRRVWDLLEVSGRVALVPEPKGRVNLALSGLELPAFAGAAAASGVEIGDGLMDANVGLRLRGEDGLALTTRTTLDSLSLSEPPDGPISQYLRLPAPLDTVLFLLRNDQGQQVIPLRVEVPSEGMSGGAIAGAAANALGTLIVDALSSAPTRLLGPLTDLVGAVGLAPAEITAETVWLTYAPGTTLPGNEAAGIVDPIVAALRGSSEMRVVIQHELGAEDIARAEILANPDPERGLELVTRLRDRKAEIARDRGELSALIRALYAVGSEEEAVRETGELRRLDREALATEEALDRVLALLRPGAERRREQRTRVAALALARERMRLLERLLIARGGTGIAARLDVRRPRYPVADDDGAELPAHGVVTITPRARP